ncbi:hypothetical protein [Oenococcus oeni]
MEFQNKEIQPVMRFISAFAESGISAQATRVLVRLNDLLVDATKPMGKSQEELVKRYGGEINKSSGQISWPKQDNNIAPDEYNEEFAKMLDETVIVKPRRR